MKFGKGQAATRVEDFRLVTGRGRYTDDHAPEGTPRAVFLRSPYAHGRIVSVDVAAARTMPGVLGVFTGADIAAAGLAPLPCPVQRMFPLSRPDGGPAHFPPRHAITRDKVRHVGDIIAMVVAETAAEARDAAEVIAYEIEELPAVTLPLKALEAGAPAVWDECPDNISFLRRIGDFAAVDAAFAAAAHTVRFKWRNARVAPAPMENRAALAMWDPADRRFTLISGTQGPHDLRANLAEVFRLPQTDIRVISPDMGGAFGMRSNSAPEIVLTMFAARALGRPVKWTGDRSESFMADDQGRDSDAEVELALDADLRFTGLRVRTVATVGAYMSAFGPLPMQVNVGGLAGVYRTPAIATEVVTVFTNTPNIAPYRGAGRPEATFSIELAIDLAARELGVDRVELRKRNMIPTVTAPYKTGLTFVYDCGDFPAVFDQALQAADVAGFAARKAESAKRGLLRGLGIVYAVEQAGGGFDEAAEVRVDAGGAITVMVGTHSHGQGHETVFRQIVADQFGLDFERIRIVQGDTDLVAHGHGTFGSRSASVGGTAILRAGDRVIDKAKKIAAVKLEVGEQDIAFADGRFTVVGTDKAVAWQEVTALAYNPRALPPGFETGLAAHATITPPAPTFPNGCHVCEAEVDPETGVARFVRYTVVDDVGNVLNPPLMKGQIMGGVAQGLGQVLTESVEYDQDSGQVLTGSFMDYGMPHADQIPAFDIASHPVPTKVNPLGIKGAGEAGSVGGLPAGFSAILNALQDVGVRWLDMPCTPHRVWQAIQAAKAAA